MFIFDSWAAVTSVKYEYDAKNLAGTLVGSKILLTENLTNGALVTPPHGLPILVSNPATEHELGKKHQYYCCAV